MRRPVAKEAVPPKPEEPRQPPASDGQPDEVSWIVGLETPEYEFEPGYEPDFTEHESHPVAEPRSVGSTSESVPSAQDGLGGPSYNANNLPSKPSAPRAAELSPSKRPPYYWTWLLLSRGFLADECLAIRGITRDVLLDHLLQAAENGLAVKPGWILAEETIAALDRLVGDERPDQIRPLLARLPAGTRYEEVQIYLKCRQVGEQIR